MKIAFAQRMLGRNRRGERFAFDAGRVFDAEIKRLKKRCNCVECRSVETVDILIGRYLLPSVNMKHVQVMSDDYYCAAYTPAIADKRRWIPEDCEESMWDEFPEKG